MNQKLVSRLQNLELLRGEVEMVDKALGQLVPADQLIVRKLVMDPGRNHAATLCQVLDVEPVTVYRRKRRALRKLEQILYPG